MFENKEKGLYEKYMAFNSIMLETHPPLEIAAIMAVQALSFYKSVLSENDYDVIVNQIYKQRFEVPTFNDR